MCEPILISTAVAGLSAGLEYQGAKEQGKADLAVARYNARIQENESIRTRNKGVEEENIHREKAGRLLETQRAQLAASGVALGEGSALTILDDTRFAADRDALRIRDNYRDQADAQKTQSELTLLQGKNARRLARIKGVYGGISTGIQTGLSTYGVASGFSGSSRGEVVKEIGA